MAHISDSYRIRLTPLPPYIPRLSSPKPRPRHGRQHAHLSLLNLILNQSILSFILLLALLLRLLFSLNFPTVPLPGSRHWSTPTTSGPTFLFPSQRPCIAEPEATCPSLDGPRTLRRLIPFLPLFSFIEFVATATNLCSSTATGPDKVAYPMPKHFPRSGMDFLLHIFNLSWSLHSFPSIWKTSSITPIYTMEKPLDSPTSFRPISLSSCVSKFLNVSFYLVYSSFWSITPSSLSPRADFRPGQYFSIKFCFFLSPFQMGLTNSGLAFRRFLLLSTSLRLFTLSGIWLFFHKLISAGLLFFSARWTQSSLFVCDY